VSVFIKRYNRRVANNLIYKPVSICILLGILIVALLTLNKAKSQGQKDSQMIETSEYIIYIPEGIDYTKQYPFFIALSPSADAHSMITLWKPIADEYHLIIFASKEFRNRLGEGVIHKIVSSLEEASPGLPIDDSQIVATGVSGGGMGAHGFSFLYPELIRAVVVNTGMMHSAYIVQKERYPRSKVAVFLASPTDFRYDEMKRDRQFLNSLDWQTKWIEFEGGHKLAPHQAYREAIQWLKQNF
jgi:predicted esterase